MATAAAPVLSQATAAILRIRVSAPPLLLPPRLRTRALTGSSSPPVLALLSPLPAPGLACRAIRQQQNAPVAQQDEEDEDEDEAEEGGNGGNGLEPGNGGNGGNGNGGNGDVVALISSALVFGLWTGLLIYASSFSPNQTPVRDQYFIQKLVGLQNDDFAMNQVLVCLFYLMGLWPLVYSMLLIPSGRSSKNGVPVWPFASLSMFIGVFGLLPYFGLWKPPPPSVSSEEIQAFPLKIFESKIFSAAIAGAGTVIIGFALLAGAESWAEFFGYFRESRFIHIMSIDFMLLSSLAPFWVYNDSVVRKWPNENIWLLALVPLLGPAFYLIFRRPISISKVLD